MHVVDRQRFSNDWFASGMVAKERFMWSRPIQMTCICESGIPRHMKGWRREDVDIDFITFEASKVVVGIWSSGRY